MQDITRRHRDTENFTLYNKETTDKIIASAIEVHRHLGPGLLESAYEECFCHELHLAEIPFERQKPLPLEYKGIKLNCGYRIDIVVDEKVVVELKCVDKITPVHEAQLLTYLRLSNIKVGLIINFYTDVLKNGIKRLVL
ncbi:GxxExxY protein [bacterium]|nr:GxxExxY protein [bacterium]MBU1598501.1 GxxExxY protein [bacterium]MBU2461673.1 GxxExxY protein [bacterium]